MKIFLKNNNKNNTINNQKKTKKKEQQKNASSLCECLRQTIFIEHGVYKTLTI